jgi:glycosyltransferase involved in cell wall biosynthesis
MITVVHVITQLELGGAQQNTLDTCEDLDRSRYRVALVYGPGGILDDRLKDLEDTTTLVPVPELVRAVKPRTDAAAFSALRAAFWRLQADHWQHEHGKSAFIVHTHCSKAGILGRAAAKAAEVPVIVHSIHGFGFHEGQHPIKHALFLNAERAAGRVTDAFIGVSNSNLVEASRRGIIPNGCRTELIRSGMDLSTVRAAEGQRRATRESLGLDSEDEMVLAVSNLKPQKDPITLVRAMRILMTKRPRAVLMIAGDGELRGEVEREIARSELEGRVRLLGWRRDIPELLAASDVVALSSIFEGLPRAAVLAVAARRPFVGTRVNGTPEIIRDGKNGYLVNPGNPNTLAQALAKALVSRPIDPADEKLIEQWDVGLMVRQQEALYESLVSTP